MTEAAGRLLAIFRLVAKRSLHNARVLFLPLAGLIAAVSVISAIPLYSHGTLERLLRSKLVPTNSRPVGSVWVRHLEEINSHATLSQYTVLNSYLNHNLDSLVGLPRQRYVKYITGDSYLLWPASHTGVIPPDQRIYGSVAWQSDLMRHVAIIRGRGLTRTPTPDGSAIPAVLNQATARSERLTVGDRVIYSDLNRYNPHGVVVQIVGVWKPTNPRDSYWLYDPNLFTSTLFVNRADLFDRVFAQLPNAPYEFSWYAVYDVTALHSVNAGSTLAGLELLKGRARQIMPGTTEMTPLTGVLSDFENSALLLNLLLLMLSVPTVVVTLFYVGAAIGMTIDRERNEIALLKSRGASTLQIIGVYSIQGLLLGAAAMVVGVITGMGIAELIGDSYGFLLFAQRPPLPLWLDPETIRYALAAVVLSVLAAIVPAISAARHTIVTYKQEVSRWRQSPVWQRFFIDFLLLAISWYGYRVLSQSQSIVTFVPATFSETSAKLFIDPLLLLVPSLAIFGAALLFVRLFPVLSAVASFAANSVAGAPIVLSLRQIARTPRQFSSLVLLLAMTLALGTFSASAAQTIDRNLNENVYYREPADLTITEKWHFDPQTGAYQEPPLTAHDVPGVVAWSPWNSYTVVAQRDRSQTKDQLLAIDRLTFPKVAWWRSDFANEPLGALMNALAVRENAILVQQSFLDQYSFHVGDIVTLVFQDTPVDFYIADTIKEFPTLYPDQSYIFVANLSYINDQLGLTPYRVWYKLDPNVSAGTVVNELRKNGIVPISIQNSRIDVNTGRTDPQRTGLFGILSIGFAVAALLTVLGFFLHSFLSFERRLLQMGILRATGMTLRQLFGLLVFEQIYLVFLGAGVGTALGVFAGDLFIPFFQASTGFQRAVPPFIVDTAWQSILRIYVVLGFMLVAGLAGTATLIARMKLYRTIKLGEDT